MTTDCGNPSHGTDCLCDVVIAEPIVPRFHFDQLHLADVIIDATGADPTNGGAELATFLTAYSAGVEATARLRDFDQGWLDGALASDLPERLAAWIRSGQSVVDAPDEFGESFARILAVLTRGQPSTVWTWGEATWAEFEEVMTAKGAVAACEVERRFGVTRQFVGRMAQVFYGTQLLSDEKARRNVRMRELFELDLPNVTVVEVLNAEGYEVKFDAVKKMRQRWRKQQEAA